jgi:hypothetical protein
MILKFYLTPVRMATIKKTNKNKCGQGLWWGAQTLYTASGDVN